MLLADVEHFARAPEWTWYILFYFFFGGLTGGSYAVATLLRLGNRLDEPAARVGYYISFPTLLVCPVLLTLDLGQPTRFWHMLVNTTPGDQGAIFKYWSPMSVGSWALLVFGFFSAASFVDALVRDGKLRWLAWAVRPVRGAFGTLFSAVGAIFGLFIAGYTGVLLAVSNQPVWSDTWTLGALFLASGLSGSAALIGWLVRYRDDAEASAIGLARGERFFQVLELALIALFAFTLFSAGTLDRAIAFPWLLLWLLALFGLVVGLSSRGGARTVANPDGTVAVRVARAVAAPSVALVLIGILALRAAVIFSAQ
jgi:formate-dependent nitrite reductase membrane component NrfD